MLNTSTEYCIKGLKTTEFGGLTDSLTWSIFFFLIIIFLTKFHLSVTLYFPVKQNILLFTDFDHCIKVIELVEASLPALQMSQPIYSTMQLMSNTLFTDDWTLFLCKYQYSNAAMSCCLATTAFSGRRQTGGGRTDIGQNFLSSWGTHGISNNMNSF